MFNQKLFTTQNVKSKEEGCCFYRQEKYNKDSTCYNAVSDQIVSIRLHKQPFNMAKKKMKKKRLMNLIYGQVQCEVDSKQDMLLMVED